MPESESPERIQRKTTSIAQLFATRVQETPDRQAYRYPVGEDWRSMTWRQAGERVKAIAAGLLSLGLHREERVGILSNTRLEWLLCDLGILSAGGATTTVYPSSTPEECAYILADSDTKYVFVEDGKQLEKLQQHRGELPKLAKVILIDGAGDKEEKSSNGAASWTMTLAELETAGATHLAKDPRAVDDVIKGIQGEHLATLIYTSGTTGKPKGVRLLHECWAYTADAMEATKLITADDVQYLWLPMSHSFGKVLMAGHIASGSVCAVDGRIPKLVDNLSVVKPTLMAAVPRIFEKVYNKILEGAKQGGMKQRIFEWALATGKQGSRLRQAGKEPGGFLSMKLGIANKLVFSKIKDRFGGRVRYFISGSAPLSRDIAEFFHACGILILEGYGLTESSAASFVNRPSKYSFGSVGLPMPGTVLKLAPEDKEILMKSPGIMQGYHNLPDQTAESLTEDGWLRTGDIGEVDDDGFLRITDRKKDLIKTSGGKYIAPQHIEGKLKATCPYISQVIIHGDKRNFVTALVTLDEEATMKWAREKLDGKPYGEVVQSDAAKSLISPYIDEVNKQLAKYETVKQFAILPKDLSVDEGELTPSLKVKRKVVEKKYAHLLDKMYEGSLASAD
ncbi:MAG: long-chain fatty acid--CoA ligase [Deltaproteobacteria bacterium]|nr:long-chain fatty acid--CoA ligase [Deltaproteobacteria bacterium]MCW5807621.1 long-chain fatty acid--CoA ligase [Deltaproteobacteria bacterium]